MAARNYLVEGLSGAGKSSVYDELIRRGYTAISTDRAWKVQVDATRPVYSIWNEQKAFSELESPEPEVLFVCGSSRNRDHFLPYFAKVFNLHVDDDTMRRRLLERTNNDFGKQPEELELMLTLNRSGEKPAGAIDIDATRRLDQVIEEVLRLADCSPVASDSARPPWSRRGSAIAQSFVIAEPALPTAGDRDVLSREAIVRLEYAWSADVLATVLRYLDEQGISLLPSDGEVFVFRPEHRAEFVARLDPSAFDGAELRRSYEELNETTAKRVEYAMLDGIAFLRDTLEALEDGTVAVLVSG